MQIDSDVVLIGTGIAPLIAANTFLAQGKSILLLNPDPDFFLENSELPFDPFLHRLPTAKRLKSNTLERTLETLRPDFPGAIEHWSPETRRRERDFHDATAPHVRQRGRLWISSLDSLDDQQPWDWNRLEELFVESSDMGFKPQILEGSSATRYFPGIENAKYHGKYHGDYKALLIPDLCDVDVSRYRIGLLEYITERLGPDQVLCGVNQLELIPKGIRFRFQNQTFTAKAKEAVFVYFTPKLLPWILQNQSKDILPVLPSGIRCWEQWSINSRENLDPSNIGILGDMAVWSEFEGAPSPQAKHVAVLRAGALLPIHESRFFQNWLSTRSLYSLSHLCQRFLKWDRFSVRSFQARTIFEWDRERKDPWQLSPSVWVVPRCDGPLSEVIRRSRKACEIYGTHLSEW